MLGVGWGGCFWCRHSTGAGGIWLLPPPPPPHTHTHRKKRHFQQCRGVCGFERKKANARVHKVSTSPNIDVLWYQHWNHSADRRARRGGRTSSNAGRCCSACNTKPNPSAEWAERRTCTASRRTCVCMRFVPAPARFARTVLRAHAHFALPMRAAARARRGLHSDPRVQ